MQLGPGELLGGSDPRAGGGAGVPGLLGGGDHPANLQMLGRSSVVQVLRIDDLGRDSSMYEIQQNVFTKYTFSGTAGQS